MLTYPKHPQIIDIADNFDFDMDGYFKYLMDNKVMPNPRERYRMSQSAIQFKRATKYLSKAKLHELKSDGLLTFVKRNGKLWIVNDNLWKALVKYLKANQPKEIRNLKHCIAA